MLARMQSCAVVGIDAFPVAVEVDVSPGLFKMEVVDLPDAAVKESKERVRSAIRNSGFRPPRGVMIINLAPADMRKEGSALTVAAAGAHNILKLWHESQLPCRELRLGSGQDQLCRYLITSELEYGAWMSPSESILRLLLFLFPPREDGYGCRRG